MKTYSIHRWPARLLAVGITLFSLSVAVRAADDTWSGNGGTPNWSDAGNWDNVPVSGDDLIFSGPNQTANVNDIAGLSLGWLWFNNGGYDLSGNPLALTGGITNSYDGNTVELNVTFSAPQAVEADSGTLTFSGALTNTGGLTINGAGSVAWTEGSTTNYPARSITGSGNLIINGPGSVNVTAPGFSGGFIYGTGITGQNFAGNTIVNGGTLNWGAGCFDGNSPIGQSVTINPGGTVVITAAHPVGANGRPFSIYGGSLDMEESAYFTSLTLSNATLTTTTTWDLRTTSGSMITNLADSASGTSFGAVLNLVNTATVGVALGSVNPAINFNSPTTAIEGAGGLTKTGLGTMMVSGPDIHTGTTTINAGTLALSSTMANTPVITVASNAVFDISAAGFSLSANQTLAGVGTVIGTLYDNNAVTGAAISPGGNGTVGTLTFDGLNLSGNTALNFDLANTTGIGSGTNDLLIVTNLTLANGVTNIVNINAVGGSLLQNVPYTLIKYVTCSAPAGQITTLAGPVSHFNYAFTNDTANSRVTVTITGNPFNLVWKGDGVTNAWDIVTTTNWLNGAVPAIYFDGDNTTFNDVGSNTPPVNLTTTVKPTTLTVNATKNYVFSGPGKISGGSKLVKSNSGNLTLLTPNDFSGGSSLDGSGAVTVGNGGTTAANLGSGNLTNDTTVTFFENASVTYAGNMSGTGSLVSFMPGATLTLNGTNTFTGGLTVANGTLQIGNATVASVTGTITNYATLNLYRSDAFTNQNLITSAGNTLEYGNGDINVRGAGGMTADGSASINTLPYGSLSVGQSASGKLTVNPGAVINLGYGFYLGNPNAAGDYGIVVQNGGTINVGNNLRIGHWASEVSFYTMNGGTLNVPNNDLAVGWDGVGLMTLNNGTVSCRTFDVDDDGITAAINGTNSTFTMNGGTLNIGTGGIAGATQTNAVLPTIILGGGTIGTLVPSTLIAAGWSSVMNMFLTNSGPTFDSSNSVITLSGILSGNGGLTKQGTGYLNLNNATNSYTGTTTVAAGTLQGSGTIAGPVVVQSGANLSAGGTLATGTLTTSNVTLNTGANVVIDASSTAATSDLIYVKGALALDTATPLIFNFLGGTPYTAGPYTVVSNLLARTGHLVLAPPGLTRYSAAVDESNPNRIQINFSGTNASLVWQGNVSTNWNINADANWLNAGGADKYYQSDAVIFDDTGISQSNINLSATVTPAKVTVDTSGNYTFSGSPIAGVATLTKSGSGTLTLVNSNSYSGITTIAGGTLQVGSGVTSGLLTANGVVDNYGSLVFNCPTPVIFNGIVNGPGTLTQAGSGTLLITATQNHYGGSTINSGSTVQLGNGALADSGSLGNGTVTNNGTVNFYRLSSIAVATPYTGGGAFNFLGTGNSGQSAYSLNATNTFTGPVTLNYARIQSGLGALSFGGPSSIMVNPGSAVYATATATSPTYNLPLTLAGAGWQDGLGALRMEGNGTWAGNITLAANSRIAVTSASTNTITGAISGNYELETYGNNAAGALVLAPSSANAYNALRVSIGTAGTKTIAGNNNAIPNNIPLTMNGGTLWLNGYDKTFSPFYNLSSSSSVQNGSTSSPASVTLTPVLGSSTYSGTFADGATQPLNVTLTQTPGLWTTALTTASPNWTGSLTNNGGVISNNIQNTAFGSQSVVGRSIVGNNGAVFVTTINNVFNGYNGNMVLNNSTWICNRYVGFAGNAGSLNLANSTVTGTDSTDGSYEMLQLPSTVTVRGTSPSYLLGYGTSPAYDLQSGGTTFDVANVTGNANSDLIVGGGSSTTFLHPPDNTSSGGSLTKIGAGTLELDGANTYTGPTTISAGTVALGASASLASSSISIASGAKLDVSALASGLSLNTGQTLSGSGTVNGSLNDGSGTVIQPGGSGTAGTLTITTNLTLNGSCALVFDLANTTGSGNDKLVVGGNLTLSSGTPTPVNFNFLNGIPALGTPYTLIQCGSISGTAATAFTNSPTRYGVTYGQTATTITVTFNGSASNLVWTGTDPVTPSTWDVATSTNWFDGSVGNVFYQFDPVRFDDTSMNTTVTLNSTVTPQAITVDTTNTYTITGTGAIAGNTGITKTNTGTLTLGTVNTFTGPINLAAGKLTLGVNDSLPPGTTVTVATNAVFDFTDNNGNTTTRGYSFIIGGAGPDGNGSMVDSVNGGGIFSYACVSNLTLTADSVIGGIERWDIGSDPNSKLDGQGHNLTVIGTAANGIRSQIITNLASITVSNQLVFYQNYNQTNSWTANTTNYVAPGSALGIYGAQTINLPVVLNGATIENYGGGSPAVWTGGIVISNISVFNNGAAQNFYGVIAGPGAMWVDGGTTNLTLTNANTYAGGTFISNAPATTTAVDVTPGVAAVSALNPGAFGSGPITISGLNYPALSTNAAYFTTNVLRAVEFNFSAPGTVPNNILLPPTTITNVSLHGHDSGQAINLSGVISGGFTGLTNWIDFGDANGIGVMRYGNTANTFVGNISAFRGLLAITGDGSLGNAANILRLNNSGGLRFDAPNITLAHALTLTASTTFNVYGDNNGDGIPETANNATITGAFGGTVGLNINITGGTNIAGTCYGSLTLNNNNTNNSQVTVLANTKLIAASASALGGASYYCIVNAGGTLSLSLNGTYNTKALQLSGSGVSAGGAGVGSLENLAGNNIDNSTITLNAASTIGLTAGNLTLGGVISGAYPLTITAASPANTLTLSAAETYSAGTLINGGTVLLNGSLPIGNAVSVSPGATLGGSGTINGPVATQAGALLQPGAGGSAVGKLIVNSTLNLGGNTVMFLNNANPTNSQIAGISTVVYGGNLNVTNLGSQASLTSGSKFILFSAANRTGSFASVSLPALASGLVWSNSLAIDGSIQVVNSVNLSPTNLTATLSGNTLTLSWPGDHTGWTLQSQTNNLTTGLGATWFPVAGSTTTNAVTVTLDPAQPTVFYRLYHP